MKKDENITYYPLLKDHGSLILAEGLAGKIYNNLCVIINFDQDDIDPDIMENAINQTILRYPSTRLRRHDTKENGKKVVKQYLVDEPETRCVRLSFKSDKKLNKFVRKLVSTKFPNNYQDCDLYKVYLVKKANGRYGVLMCMYHLIIDSYGLAKFSEDFSNIYYAMKNNTEMPKPFKPLIPAYQTVWDYETSKRHQADIEFWNDYWDNIPALPQYAALNGFENKQTYIPGKKFGNYLYIFNCKAVQTNYKIPKELVERTDALAKEGKFSAKMLYMLAIRTWLSKNTEKTEEFLIVDLLANRSNPKVAKTGGCFASGMPFYMDAKNSMTVIEACKYTSECQFKFYMHSKLYEEDCSARLEQRMEYGKKFEKGWVRGSSAIIFTYQPRFMETDGNYKISCERFTSGKSPMPIYITVMPNDTYSGDMNVNYEYMTKIHKEEDIAEFHSFLIKFLDKATSNPELTLGELMDM
ncbi:MAG: condensation domain-containing protein [Acutalibacteraceae bacterium]